MKDIKTKEVTTKPKTKNPASRIPKELMRTAILESKEKSQAIANARDNDMGGTVPIRICQWESRIRRGMGCKKDRQNCNQSRKDSRTDFLREDQTESRWQKRSRKRSGERNRQRNRGHTDRRSCSAGKAPGSRRAGKYRFRMPSGKRRFQMPSKQKSRRSGLARETPRIQNGQEMSEGGSLSIKRQNQKSKAGDTARQNAIRQKQPETIRIKEKPRKQLEPKTIQRRTIKTAPPSVKISIQPEQKLRVASSNALTARMQKQMERRAAKQAAKKAALQTSDGIRRIQKTARAGENTFKAAKAAVEAAAKTVQSMMAALGAAGAVMVLLLVIMVGIIGGAAFSGSSESNEALSQEVLSYTATIQKYANQYGIPEYVSVIQAIMMQESGGRGTDPMQSSECPYNTRYSNSPNAIQDADYSIQVGIQYYADCLKRSRMHQPTGHG